MKKIDYSNVSHLVDNLLTLGNTINNNPKSYKNFTAFVQEIKSRIIKMKPLLDKKKDVSVYINDIDKYYNEKMKSIIDEIITYKDILSDFLNEFK